MVRGDLLSSVVVTFSAILPTSVSRPVPHTTARALPVKTEVPAYNIFFLETSLSIASPSSFKTPILSPVRIDSSIVKLLELIILASADILVPDSRKVNHRCDSRYSKYNCKCIKWFICHKRKYRSNNHNIYNWIHK